MEKSEPNKVRELTPEEYKIAYVSPKNLVTNALRATELRLFGEIRKKSYKFYHDDPQFPDFERIYAEELIKSQKRKDNNEFKTDVKMAGWFTGVGAATAGIFTAAFSGHAHYDLPNYPEYDNNPDKQARIDLPESPHAVTTAEVKKLLEERAAKLEAEREKEYQEINKKRKDIKEQAKEEEEEKIINGLVKGGVIGLGVLGTASAVAVGASQVKRLQAQKTRNPDALTTGQSL